MSPARKIGIDDERVVAKTEATLRGRGQLATRANDERGTSRLPLERGATDPGLGVQGEPRSGTEVTPDQRRIGGPDIGNLVGSPHSCDLVRLGLRGTDHDGELHDKRDDAGDDKRDRPHTAAPQGTQHTRESMSRIPLSVPSMKGNEGRYLKECVDTNWVSYVGPFVDRFERSFASALNVPF